MRIFERFRKLIQTPISRWIPLYILLGISVATIASYLLASWLMRPVGDDYAPLVNYHIAASWIDILPETVLNGGGRYGQTFVSVIMYGQFGHKALQLTGLLSVALFLLTVYLAILAWQKVMGWQRNHKVAGYGAVIAFLSYTLLSITFPWIRGGIDNSFQDFLWLPGFITYTLPLTLLGLLVASYILLSDKYRMNPWVLVGAGAIAIFIGTFSEILPVLYIEAAALLGLTYLVLHRFERNYLHSRFKAWLPYAVIGGGLLIGLALNFLSAATAARRAGIDSQGSLVEILVQSGKLTAGYVRNYILLGQADYVAMLLCLAAGAAAGLVIVQVVKKKAQPLLLKQLFATTLFTGIMGISSIYICFAVVFKGYGLNSYLLPRFEILYNIWLSLCFVLIGIVAALVFVLFVTRKKWTLALPLASLALSILFILSLPYVLNQAAYRLRTVAAFSAAWQQQDAILRQAAEQGAETVTVPMIDIGEAYTINCKVDYSINWLGGLKQAYYHIPHICSTPE